MNDTKTLPDVVPSATPSEAEIAAWQSLPRDEQVRRLRFELSRPECGIVGTATFEELRARGQALAAQLRNG